MRFAGVGGAAALGYVLVSSLAVVLCSGLPAPVVSTACYALFIVPTYLAHRRFSFRSDVAHGRALPRYAAVQALGLALAALFSALAYEVLALPNPAAAIAVVVLTSAISFILLKLWAFAAHR
ncbi:GtrA family protein [Devosia enhydra]|nr:GtrA family protein [Devosia enhydra]